jgi:hypothetical protein
MVRRQPPPACHVADLAAERNQEHLSVMSPDGRLSIGPFLAGATAAGFGLPRLVPPSIALAKRRGRAGGNPQAAHGSHSGMSGKDVHWSSPAEWGRPGQYGHSSNQLQRPSTSSRITHRSRYS